MLEPVKKGSRALTFTSIISSDAQAHVRKARQVEPAAAGPQPPISFWIRFGMVRILGG